MSKIYSRNAVLMYPMRLLAAASLHCDQAARMVSHETLKHRPRELFTKNHCPVGGRAVQLKHVLRQIDPDNYYVRHVASPIPMANAP